SIGTIDETNNSYFDALTKVKNNKAYCEIAEEFASKNGIKSFKKHLVKKNIERIYTTHFDKVFERVLISINIRNATIWESKLGKTEKGKLYNCSTIDLEVPEIKEAENSILDETT
ncbi:hypothetical protein OA416_01550, partial [Paracoccaceae bacterium]|nr:hypothetical protein [Paracoccaceae bacterium]